MNKSFCQKPNQNPIFILFGEMGLSYDTAISILLCAKDNNNILCFEDEADAEDNHGHGWASQQQRSDLYGDCLMGFPLQSDECLDLMVKREVEHLSREDHEKSLITGSLDLSIRKDAIDWTLKLGLSREWSCWSSASSNGGCKL